MKKIKVSHNLDADLRDSIQRENMQFGKIPNNVGYPRGMQGVTRKLTKKEIKQQSNLQRP